jgi:hypothetical protein
VSRRDVLRVDVELRDALAVGQTLRALARSGLVPVDAVDALERVGEALRSAGYDALAPLREAGL